MADVIRNAAGDDGRIRDLRATVAQKKVLHAIAACRTARLGGHTDACTACGNVQVSYNSCRNRHCPKCQASKQAQWLEARCRDLVPVPYFHVVFTLPAELAPLALQNQREVYKLIFEAAASTLKVIALDPKHLGAHLGFIAVLHTWGQTLVHHPHVHCVIPGGGLSLDRSHWVGSRKDFFLPVRVLACLYRGKLLACLRRSFGAERLHFFGKLEGLANKGQFDALCEELSTKQWVVYAKPPFGGPEQVLKYLARYTHRVAIANRRIVEVTDKSVTFTYKDYARGNKRRRMTLGLVEFIRRFSQHVLPRGFVRIRHYGFLANRVRAKLLALCRNFLQDPNEPESLQDSSVAPAPATKTTDGNHCSHCGAAMQRLESFGPQSTREYQPRPWPRPIAILDSS